MTIDLDLARQILRHHRDEPLFDTDIQITDSYDPNLVIELGEKLIEKRSKIPEIEYYNIIEQVMVANMDIGNFEVAKKYFQQLESKFVTGSRIQKLRGQLEEYQGNYDQAITIYARQLEVDPNYFPISKRMIMAFIAKGDRTRGIELLVSYIDTYSQDIDAWTTLTKLYCQQGFYQQAAFCLEELLLLKPKYHVYMLQYAELVSALGQLETGLNYYCGVVELVPESLHAWYGIHYTTTQLLAKNQEGNRDHWKLLLKLSKEKIAKSYTGSSLYSAVESWLQ